MGHVGTTEQWYQQYRDQGFIALYLLAENEDRLPADLAATQAVAAENGATYPILADVDWLAAEPFNMDDSLPDRSLLSPGLVVEIVDEPIAPEVIETYLP